MNEWKDANKEELLNRIDDVINYLNCGITHERETIINILTRQKPEPKQPTHEELADEYAEKEFPIITEYSNFEQIASEVRNGIAKQAFIAGSKSIPPETE